MEATQPHQPRAEQHRAPERTGVVIEMSRPARTSGREDEHALRCVSSGYMYDGCSCRCTVPASVAHAAWEYERTLEGNDDDRLFHFAWRGEVWLAYGLAGGEIRGIYCPTHRAAREAHAAGRRLRPSTSYAAVALGA